MHPIYITVGLPPMFKIEGVVEPYGDTPLTTEDTEAIAASTMNSRQAGSAVCRRF